MRAHRWGSWIPLVLLLIFYAGYVLYPVGVMTVESLRSEDGFSLSHYADILRGDSSGNLEAAVNSVYVSVLSVVLGGLVGGALAFCVTQLNFPFRRLVSLLAVVPVALPPLVGVIAFLFVFGESGILPRLLQAGTGIPSSRVALDGIPAIVAVHVYSFNTYFFLFVSAALRQTDGSLVDAAAGLGASPSRILRLVILPGLRPALLGASILTFMASMASFSAPLLFAGGHRFITLQIFTTKLNGDLPLAAALSLLLTVVSLVFFVTLQLVSGARITLRRTKGTGRAGILRVHPAVRAILIGLSALLITLEALPLVVIVIVSFAREGSWTWQLFPSAYTLENYTRLLGERQIFEPVLNSSLMGLIALAVVLLVGVAGALLEKTGFVDFASELAPGLRDVLLTGKVYQAARRRMKGQADAVDAVVMDAPPTGRIENFLTAGEALAEVVVVGPIAPQAQSIMALLRAETTQVHLVTTCTEMALTETLQTIDALTKHGIAIGHVIVNQVMADPPPLPDGVTDPALRAAWERDTAVAAEQRPWADRLAERLSELGRGPALTLPLLPDEVGPDDLVQIADLLAEGWYA